ncbi:MAG: CesT family type III secretion system chaperone [Polyangiaceae bacterium]
MIQASEDLEGFLARLERPFERASSGVYVLRMGTGGALVALHITPPVLLVRAEIGKAPTAAEPSRSLYKKLLELNASSLVHASYGLEGELIVLSAALELTSIDLNELEAVLADVDLALAEHVPALHEMVRS